MKHSKSIFTSKTFWTNFAVGSGFLVQKLIMEDPVVPPNEIAIATISAANLVLRSITNKPVHVVSQ